MMADTPPAQIRKMQRRIMSAMMADSLTQIDPVAPGGTHGASGSGARDGTFTIDDVTVSPIVRTRLPEREARGWAITNGSVYVI